MEDIRFDGGIGLKINNLGFISVVRKKNFSFSHKENVSSLLHCNESISPLLTETEKLLF